MKKLGFVTLGILVGALATAAFAEDAERLISGLMSSHRAVEEFDISVGLSTGGRPLRARPVKQEREQLHLPEHYGALVAVTAHGNSAVLWYRGADGVLRNAVVEDPVRRPYRIQAAEVFDLTVETYR